MYLQDIHKSRKPNISLEKQLKIVVKVTTNQYGCEKLTTEIDQEVIVLQSLVVYILKKNGFNKVGFI